MNPRDPLPNDPLSTARACAGQLHSHPQRRLPPAPQGGAAARRAGPPRTGADGEPAPAPVPLPFAFGARVLMWKQDPSVTEIGTRKAFLPGIVLEGPRDARIVSGDPGIAPVSPNAFGDFIPAPNTPSSTPSTPSPWCARR